MSDLSTYCPHCYERVFIDEVNCGIFRHGLLVTTGKQIEPHLSKEICDYLVKEQLILGCGKPFQVFFDNTGQLHAEPCGYI